MSDAGIVSQVGSLPASRSSMHLHGVMNGQLQEETNTTAVCGSDDPYFV